MMKDFSLSFDRQRRSFGRYTPLLLAAALIGNTAFTSGASARHYPMIFGENAPGPEMNLRRADPRPQKLNLVLGRVENALNRKTAEAPDTAKPDIKPPAPAPVKGSKAAKMAAAFMAAMIEAFPPPPNSGLRPIYIASMSIGGKRLEPD